MKNAAVALAILALSGCSILGISDKDLPPVWVLEEVVIRVAWDEPASTPNAGKIGDVLRQMNLRIVDATDGQVRIARFKVVRAAARPELAAGVGTIQAAELKGEGFGIFGTPSAPGAFRFFLHGDRRTLEDAGAEAAHEFFHAWVGLRDEYKKLSGKEASCPASIVTRGLADSCLMYSYRYSELCRESNHNEETEQHQAHGMSCYEWLRKTLADHGRGQIRIPRDHLRGPDEAPEPTIEIFK